MSGTAAGPGPTRWDKFLYWSNRFFQEPEFDRNERDYKLVVFARLRDAKDAFTANDPAWIDKLNLSVTTKPNNLTNWRATQPVIAWCRAQPDDAGLAFRFLWNEDLAEADRFDQFVEVVRATGPRILIAETSFFHSVMNPALYPVYRPVAVERAMVLTGYPDPKEQGIGADEMGRRYDHYLWFLDLILKRGKVAGIPFRDRLDAQGASWTVTQWSPVDRWSDDDKGAFLTYQGNADLRKDTWRQG
jgi:hypothetical protein